MSTALPVFHTDLSQSDLMHNKSVIFGQSLPSPILEQHNISVTEANSTMEVKGLLNTLNRTQVN